MMKNVLVVVVILLGVGSYAQAAVFDFEAPTYDTGILNEDGWVVRYNYSVQPSGHASTTVDDAHPYAGGGSQYLDFGVTTVYADASHALTSVDTGIIIAEYANYYAGPGASSGKLMLTNAAAGDELIGVGVDNGGNGPNFLVAHGAGPTNRVYGMDLPAAFQWFLMRVELDLDADTADVMWKQNAGDSWIPIYNGYATNDFALDGVRLENRKEANGFDNISIVPEPATMSLLGLGCCILARRRRK